MTRTQQFAVKNLKSGRLVKDAITTKVDYYDSRELADRTAFNMNRFAAVDERSDRYVVVEVQNA